MTLRLLTPNLAVSVRGRARVVRESLNVDQYRAVVDIDVGQVKNDMVRNIVIESAVTVSAVEQFRPWFEAVLGEVEEM